MNPRNRFFSGLLMAATFLVLGGCAGVLPRDDFVIPSRGYQSPRSVITRGAGGCIETRYHTAIPVSMAVPCEPPGGMGNQVQVAGRTTAPQFQGMLPETAAELLARLDRMNPQPCSSSDNSWRTTVGTFVGALLGQAIGGDSRATLIGALIGALGGNSNAQMTCNRYGYLGLQLRLVIDNANRCSGEVRRTNGVIADDERCTYQRRYTPQHQPPQIGDRR